jgi:hypothetical protein
VTRDLHEIAYETAIRALDQQERHFEQLRARAATLLAASSLVLPLLGPPLLDDTSSALPTLAVLLSFLGSAGASLFVLIPRRDIGLSLSPLSLFELADRVSDHDALRRVVLELHGYRRRNDRLSRSHTDACRTAGLLLALETVLLVAIRTGGII